jgi:hypothetical protein
MVIDLDGLNLKVGDIYNVVFLRGRYEIDYDTVKCLDILKKTYRVESKSGHVYLLKKNDIIEINGRHRKPL